MADRKIKNDCLANTLHVLGVHFVGVSGTFKATTALSPVELIGGLAHSSEARLRLALIPLFLCRPDFALFVPATIETLHSSAQVTLKCYYTAALLLQEKYKEQFVHVQPLSDFFSYELSIPQQAESESQLRALAHYQTAITGDAINWLGTYEYAVQRLIKMEKHKQPA